MKQVKDHITFRQSEFSKINFFQTLENADSLDRILPHLKKLAFFVLTFQDVLNLNESRITDKELKSIAKHHQVEDRGHDKWFIHDIKDLEGTLPSITELFGSEHRAVREASYRMVSEMYNSDTDYASIALLLILEATGHLFFTSISSNLERLNIKNDLWYFSRKHLDVELKHEMFDKKINEYIDTIVLSPKDRDSIIQMTDRIFDAMAIMLNSIL
jgi:hypothetical protein